MRVFDLRLKGDFDKPSEEAEAFRQRKMLVKNPGGS